MTEERDELIERLACELTMSAARGLLEWVDIEAAYPWMTIVGSGRGRCHRNTIPPLLKQGLIVCLNEFKRDADGEAIWQFYAITERGKAVLAWLEENR